MDPVVCLTRADQAISDGELHEAAQALDDYDKWRASGGFEPIEVAGTTMRGDTFAEYCERRLDDARWAS
jgi:hypothetical protein